MTDLPKWTSIGSYPECPHFWVDCPKHGTDDYPTVKAAEHAAQMHDMCNPDRIKQVAAKETNR
jgi:hypothetical protein